METIRITKTNGWFDLTEVFKAILELVDGDYTITVKKSRNTRSDRQNRYLWGVVYPHLLQGFIDAGWDEITNEEQIHEICKAKFLTIETVNKHTGEIVNYPLSTSKMDTLQFATYVDQIADFALENLNIVIPQPEYELQNNKSCLKL